MKGIILDDFNDIKIANNEMVIEDITRQVIQHIVVANPGEYKEFPMLGIGLIKNINGDKNQFILNNIKEQLATIGVAVKNIEWQGDELLIEY